MRLLAIATVLLLAGCGPAELPANTCPENPCLAGDLELGMRSDEVRCLLGPPCSHEDLTNTTGEHVGTWEWWGYGSRCTDHSPAGWTTMLHDGAVVEVNRSRLPDLACGGSLPELR